MHNSLTRILLKIFAAGFYRVHAGMILTLFVSFFVYFFFTSVLNQTHITQQEIVLYNLKLVLTSVSNPVVMGILFLIWLFYTGKSWKYVAAQLKIADHQFLFYSANSFGLASQFRSWFFVQSVISIPVIILGVFATVIGVIFEYYIIPAIIPVYLLLLISGSAFYYIRLVNNLAVTEPKPIGISLVKSWPKPFFSLFLYQIVDKMKIPFGTAKLISWVILTTVYALFTDPKGDFRLAEITISGVVIAHTVLIYQSYEFDKTYLHFARNFPFSRVRLFYSFALLYLLLISPEIICLSTIYGLATGIKTAILGLSMALLFRSLLYSFCRTMERYLRAVFGLFIIYSLGILFGLFWSLAVLNVLLSFALFYKNYYPSLDR